MIKIFDKLYKYNNNIHEYTMIIIYCIKEKQLRFNNLVLKIIFYMMYSYVIINRDIYNFLFIYRGNNSI